VESSGAWSNVDVGANRANTPRFPSDRIPNYHFDFRGREVSITWIDHVGYPYVNQCQMLQKKMSQRRNVRLVIFYKSSDTRCRCSLVVPCSLVAPYIHTRTFYHLR
jgi:hypothetical protein